MYFCVMSFYSFINGSLIVFFLLVFFLIIRLPPLSTRTDTLFPYTTLFRSQVGDLAEGEKADQRCPDQLGEIQRHQHGGIGMLEGFVEQQVADGDRKRTRLNSSH